MKSIVLECYSEIAIDPVCYGDRLVLLDDNAIVAHFDARCWPNPYRPRTGDTYTDCYGVLAPCETEYECIGKHPKYGKCILLNGGRELPARFPNVNHDGRMVLDEVFLHSGYSSTWPGSAGCPTLTPYQFPVFMDHFEIGERGKFALTDMRVKKEIAA